MQPRPSRDRRWLKLKLPVEVKDMKQNAKNGGGGRLLGRLAAEKKKAGIALCLIAVMAFMWVKVLTKKGPQSAQARLATEQTEVEKQLNEAMKIAFVELPEVPGRNDIIGRDYFAAGNWQDFKAAEEGNTVEEVNVSSADQSKEVVTKVAQQLKLQAIGLSDKPQAFINDRLLSVGDSLAVTVGTQRYECEVVEIRKDSVSIRCLEAEITLKLVQTVEGDG
jgi:sRNA-binding protein